MTEAPGQGQNQTPTPLDPDDVAALSAELTNPATSNERVEQILKIGLEVQAQSGNFPDASPVGESRDWGVISDAQLSAMLIDPAVSSADKDSIADYVNSRNAPDPSADQ